MRNTKSMGRAMAASLFLGAALIQASPASTSQNDDPYSSAIEWCQDSLFELRQAKAQASALYSRGRYAAAKEVLVRGLSKASDRTLAWGTTGPITERAIRRVQQIGLAVDAAVARDSIGVQTTVAFLYRGYDFIESVADELDIPYYIPYQHSRSRRGCGGCHVDPVEVERRFVEMTAAQLTAVLDSLTTRVGGELAPLGAPKAVLKALEIVTVASAFELEHSLWRASYACLIQQLRSLAGRIQDFNRGDRLTYRNEPEAFYAFASETEYLAAEIQRAQRCY